MDIIQNNYIYKCLNEYNEIIYVGKLIRLSKNINDYFKDENNIKNDVFFYTYKIEAIKVKYEIDAYSISAYLIDKYKPEYNLTKRHYKNIKAPNIYNESDWKLIRIINPDILPIQDNNSIINRYSNLLIILLITIIVLALYIIKEIIMN